MQRCLIEIDLSDHKMVALLIRTVFEAAGYDTGEPSPALTEKTAQALWTAGFPDTDAD